MTSAELLMLNNSKALYFEEGAIPYPLERKAVKFLDVLNDYEFGRGI